ncbi:MAG: hypothetical protein AB8G05_15290 [Oligoflexales bacterium]
MAEETTNCEQATTSKSKCFTKLLEDVESFLTSYYGFESPTATDFLLEKDYLAASLDTSEKGSPRAAVCLQESTCEVSSDPELFLGIYFETDLINRVLAENPLESLNYKNLDAFCVLVEELSHFHLIFQRAQQNREVSQLELEWQGEIDKFLFSAIMLLQQQGNPHLHQLRSVLFDKADIVNHERYEAANKLAAQFWGGAISKGVGKKICLTSDYFKEFMRINYHKPLQETVPFTAEKNPFY